MGRQDHCQGRPETVTLPLLHLTVLTACAAALCFVVCNTAVASIFTHCCNTAVATALVASIFTQSHCT